MTRRTTTQRGYGNDWQKLRLVILARDNHTCHWCGGPARSVDHVTPKIDGGTNHPTNLVASCVPCNSRRSMQWLNANRPRTARFVFRHANSPVTTSARFAPESRQNGPEGALVDE